MASGVVSIPLSEPALQDSGEESALKKGLFLAGPENALAEVAAEDWLAGSPPPGPLVFSGPHGTGKTLLAAGLLKRWAAEHESQASISTTGADFARAYANAVKCDGILEFRDRYRTVGALLIDDLDAMIGKTAAQEELANTIDALVTRGHWVVVTSRHYPAANEKLSPRLTSRQAAGLVVPLVIPQAPTRRALLLAMAEQADVEIDPEAATLLADSLPVAAPSLQSALMELMATCDRSREEPCRRVDLADASSFLAQNAPNQSIEISTIAKAVAREFQLKLGDLRSTSRQQTLVRARGVAMLLARRLTTLSLKQIGGYFNRRDHTTVMHACQKAEETEAGDVEVRQMMKKLERELMESAS